MRFHLNQWLWGGIPSYEQKHKLEGHGPVQPKQKSSPYLKNDQHKKVGSMAQVVECLNSKSEAQSSTPKCQKRNQNKKPNLF
jgi:hypothetical protein